MYFNGRPLFTAEAKHSAALIPWLNHRDSLTDKLKAITGGVEITVIAQGWVTPNWWDACILKVTNELVLQREIFMRSGGRNYWYARTVIPQKCYALNPTFFKRLESESIRNLIFSKEVTRVNTLCYPVDKNCLEFYWVKKYSADIEQHLWVRLAEFSYAGTHSFYLIELLLPELEQLTC